VTTGAAADRPGVPAPARVGAGDLLAALGDLATGQAAEVYAACGYPVLPMHNARPGEGCSCPEGAGCPWPGKHPRLAGWPRLASTDPARVRGWWRRWPDAGVGLAAGARFDVLDVDGEQGAVALRAVLSIAPPEHTGPVARSGGGGWHLLYAPTGLGNRAGLAAGLDWRGRGGLIVAPPSRHACGGRYAWARPLTAALPTVPDGLWRLLAPPARPAIPTPAELAGGRAAAWARGALRRERAAVAAARRGGRGRPGRNHALNRAAFRLGQLVAAGLLDAATVTAELLAAAEACGLGQREARATIASGLAGAARKPRVGLRVAGEASG
jgi:hypothetical protein